MLVARLAAAAAAILAAPGRGDEILREAGFHHPALAEATLPRAALMPAPDPHVILSGANTGFAAEAESVDFTLLACGIRPLLLEHGPEASLLALATHARARGLTALFGPYEFEVERDLRRGGYSNRASLPRPARPGSGAWRSLLIGPDADVSALAWLALGAGWDRLLGRLLGYPACCAEAFARLWPDARARHGGDLGSLLLAGHSHPARPLPWRANIFARYHAPCLVPHFPCRFDCAATLRDARRAEACLDAFRPDFADSARAAMRGLVLEEAGGISLLPGGVLRRDGVSWVADAPGDGPFAGLVVSPEGLMRNGTPLAGRLAAFTAEEAAA